MRISELLFILFLMVFVGCAPAKQDDIIPAATPPTLYNISGSISGLETGTLLISLNNSETIALSAGSTHWRFANQLQNAAAYSVQIKAQPTNVICVLSNASGLVDSGDVVNISILCPTLQNLSIVSSGNTIAPQAVLDLTGKAIFSNASPEDVTTLGVWSSADPSIATVSAAGIVTGVSPGNVSIQLAWGGQTRTMTVTVKSITLTSLALSPGNLNLAIGMNRNVKATGTYSDGSVLDLTQAVTWASSATAVASISNTSGSQGLLHGVSAGSSTVTATLGSVHVTQSMTVSSAKLSTLDITPGFVNSQVGAILPLRVSATFSDASVLDVTESVTWSSSAPILASMSGSNLQLLAAGSVTITATYSGQSATLPVQISDKTLVSISLQAATTSLPVKVQENVEAIAAYSDGSTADVTGEVNWSSSNYSVLYVNEENPDQGLVQSLAAGSAVLQAEMQGQSASLNFAVTTATLSSLRTSPGQSLIPEGMNLNFKAYGTFSDGIEYEVTREVVWSSSNTSYADLSNASGSQGILTNKYTGTSTVGFNVVASLSSQTVTTAILITPATLTQIVINPSQVTTPASTIVPLRAYAQFSDGGSTEVTDLVSWSSGSPAVAVVSNADQAQGTMSALQDGSVTITARLGSLSGTLNVTVSETLPTSIVSQGMGLLGEYFANKVLSNTDYKGSRLDGEIDFDWGQGLAPLGVGDSFSIRWTGEILATTTENYTFCVTSDDGARLWVNGVAITNNWTDHAATENCGSINLTAGQKYSIRLEFYENGGYSTITLSEQTSTIPKQIVPRAQLFDGSY